MKGEETMGEVGRGRDETKVGEREVGREVEAEKRERERMRRIGAAEGRGS